MLLPSGFKVGLAGLALIPIVLLSCVGDGGQEEGLPFAWTLTPEQPTVGPATLTVSLADSADAPLTDSEVGLHANMSHAGMKPVLAEAEEQDSGHYRVPFEFTMAGDWYLRVEVQAPNGDVSEHVIEVPGVRSGGAER